MSEIRFTVPGAPVPFNGSPPRKGGGRFLRKADADFQSLVRLCAIKALHRWQFDTKREWQKKGEFYLECTFFVPDLIKRDRDNMLKNVQDGLKDKRISKKRGLRKEIISVSGVVEDDAMFVDGPPIKRLDRNRPRTEIVLRRVYGYLSPSGPAQTYEQPYELAPADAV